MPAVFAFAWVPLGRAEGPSVSEAGGVKRPLSFVKG